MLRPVKMKKVKVIVPLDYKNDICARLHKLGAVHISDISKRIDDAEWKHLLGEKVCFDNEAAFRQYEVKLDDINNVFSEFDDSKVKGSFFPEAQVKIKVKDVDEKETLSTIKILIDEIGESMADAHEGIERCRESEIELACEKNVLQMISGIDAKLGELNGSDYFCNKLFRTDAASFDEIRPKLESFKRIIIERTDSGNDLLVLLTYPKEIDDTVLSTLNQINAKILEIPKVQNKPKDEIRKIERKIGLLKDDEEGILCEIRACKNKRGEKVAALRDEVSVILDRYSLLSKCAGTETSFVLEFFVSERRESEAISAVKDACFGKVIVFSVEPLLEDQAHKVPVLLDNPVFLKGFEGLTRMYSTPKYNDFDPTILIAPAMMFFFGFMLNDVGYGLLLALIGFLFYAAYRKVHVSRRDAGIMLVMLGVSSVFFGVISGGYFGDALRRVFPGIWYLIDPLGESNLSVFGHHVENPIIAVMIFSLVVGVVYINIGYLLGIADCVNKIKSVKYKRKQSIKSLEDQIVGHVGMMIFQVGLFGLFFWWKFGLFSGVSYFATAMGAVLLLALVMLAKSNGVQTLFGFFDVTGYVGDDLSFIRLLALCLATEGIANIVNMFAGFSLNIPYIGIFVGSLIFVFGHVFNLMVGVLGAGIHSLRLQYVEFFSKFFDGGGVEFEPYSIKRKVTVVEK
ncbi:MAG: hypothetical protein DRN71_02805 [Candidatus Nanohalarchaeota archaeon]|nr:MAG: hypothetical protein DRN71_02805 [Candidatus Nanohaloarchaeota archaeon]